jgi:hypothetical protein
MTRTRSRALGLLAALVLIAAGVLIASGEDMASAHQSGCHRWHSCPSDSGSYVCGDLGYACQYPGGSTTPTTTTKNCADFSSQQAAQDFYSGDTSDPSGLDADNDGLACEDNPCPCAPSDPRGDGDYDTVPNAQDSCPTQYGRSPAGGCPDGDLDGVGDPLDGCPTIAGPAQAGGCPPPDADKDGVPDLSDACPAEGGLVDSAGCSMTDPEVCNDLFEAGDRIDDRLAAAKRKRKAATTKTARRKYDALVKSLRKKRGKVLAQITAQECLP